jgi:hypothetical protein
VNPIVRALAIALSAGLFVSAFYTLVPALRAADSSDDWPVVSLQAVLRAAAGTAALWASVGGGVVAGSVFVAMLLAHTVSAELVRRGATS